MRPCRRCACRIRRRVALPRRRRGPPGRGSAGARRGDRDLAAWHHLTRKRPCRLPEGRRQVWSHGRRRRSGDAPGVPRGQELRNVARPALRDRLLLLVEHDLLVHGPRDRRQHADRDREVWSEEVREELRRVQVGLVVDPERARRDVLRLDDLRPDAVHDDGPSVVLRPEEHGFAGLEPELVLELLLLVVHHVPREVVVHVAVLEDLLERGALVVGGAPQHLLHVRDVAVHRARDEGGAAAEREREGVHRAIGGAERRGFRDLAELARGRVLTLREAVDPVVEQQDRHVHVSAEHVEHVVAADRQPVAVPRHDEHLEIRACQPEPGGDGRGAAVDGVEPVGVHVVRKPARAADPRDEDDVLLRDAEVRHRLLHRGEDRVVPAARAPPDVLVGLEVLLRVLGCFLRLGAARAHVGLPTSWLMASRISSLASGRPRMRLKPTASTRYSARSTRTSWPLLISGTSTLRYSRRMWPRSGGSGFRCRRWIDATECPAACARSTAAVIEPYVPPQPTTSRSPVAGPLIVVGGISCATRRTFSARVRTMWSWLSGS